MRHRIWVPALALAAASCTSDFTGINQNPNAPTDAPNEFLVAAAMARADSLIFSGGWDKTMLSMWAQHTSQIEYAWNDRFEPRSETMNGMWSNLYAGPLEDFRIIGEKAKATNNVNQQAIASIMQSWLFQNVTDAWGDVPYTDALAGARTGNTAPKYDRQEAIYDAILAALKTAATQISPTSAGFGTADIIYSGDVLKWRRFANSLRLRMAMRLSEAAPEKARAGIQSALADGVFTSSTDDALMRWLDNLTNGNPWHAGVVEPPGGSRIAATLVDTLKSLNDPRLPIYARRNGTGQYVGMQNGLRDGHGIAFPDRSMIGERYVRRLNTPSVMMSYSEVLFIQAEAAVRGWAGGDPATLYTDAIRANMRFLGIADADIDAYLAQPGVRFDAGRAREQIALQKWISFFGQGAEAFAEWRRTGLPALKAGPDVVTAGLIARRVEYPTDEQSLNSTNVTEAMGRQGGARITNKVWWDRRP